MLDTFEVDDEEDELQEGETEVVATLTIGSTHGDLEVDRIDMTLTAGGSNEEDDAWDVFDEITLLVDGEEIASFDASDEDEYLDEDEGEFRFSNMALVLRDGEEVDVEVTVTAAGSVDGSDTSSDANWTLTVDEARYFDGDDVSENDDSTDDMGDSVDFDIVEEGADDEATVENNSDDPDATTFEVQDDNDESEDEVVFLFDIEVDEDSSPLSVEDA
ncbi:MAG: hypothetical protein DRH76_11035, partial [Deltaproteobacteria bacterium]